MFLEGDASRRRFPLGDEDDLACLRGDPRDHRSGCCEARVTAAGLQEGEGREGRGAVIPGCAGDKEDIAEVPLVPPGLAGGQRGRVIDLHADRFRIVELGGKGDVGHVEFSPAEKPGVEQVAALGQAEGHRGRRPDGRAHQAPRVAVDPRWDVEAEDGLSERIDVLDHLPVEAFHVPVESRSEDGVDDGVALKDVTPGVVNGFHRTDVDGEIEEPIQVLPRSPLVAVFPGKEKHLDDAAARVDLSCHDESVSAVVAPAAEHGKAPPRNVHLAGQRVIGGDAGVLHEDLVGNAQRLDGIAVHRPHFFRRGNLHASFLILFSTSYLLTLLTS